MPTSARPTYEALSVDRRDDVGIVPYRRTRKFSPQKENPSMDKKTTAKTQNPERITKNKQKSAKAQKERKRKQ